MKLVLPLRCDSDGKRDDVLDCLHLSIAAPRKLAISFKTPPGGTMSVIGISLNHDSYSRSKASRSFAAIC
jgi:hypothetical protein